MDRHEVEVAVVGGGIGGLATALHLHAAGIECRVFESAPVLEPLGVGITLLPHATAELEGLGLGDQISTRGVELQESVFFTSHGQLVHREPRTSGQPQHMIHRGDLLMTLLEAVQDRLGRDAVVTGHRARSIRQDEQGAEVDLADPSGGDLVATCRARALVGADGIHSAVRAALHPDDGGLRYAGIDMWRGVTRHPPFLSGGSHVRAGVLDRGRLITYPIRDAVDGGDQLVNWVAEHRGYRAAEGDWRRAGRLDDFAHHFANWHFDWLDVPALLAGAEEILEYPMVDRDPLPWWTAGRITLLGDAAHPMYPRGANGAAQALLDARTLATSFTEEGEVRHALARYESERREATTQVVLANRRAAPDDIIDVVEERTAGQRFERLEDVVAPGELAGLVERYKQVAAYDSASLAAARRAGRRNEDRPR